MKIIRLGMTETGLLFLLYLIKNNLVNDPKIKKDIQDKIKSCINWLYTTSGYYDKSVIGNYFNFDNTAFNTNFFDFINHLKIVINNCDKTYLLFYNGIMSDLFNKYKEKFISEYNIKNLIASNHLKFEDRVQEVFDNIKNKNVLVITSFDGLVKQQYENGNIYKIYNNFPILKSLETVKFPYCFFNNGPDKNYFETLDKMYIVISNEIQKKNIDIVLLGCGSFGHMLTHKIHTELNKDAIYLGGYIQTLFGIKNERNNEHSDLNAHNYWITEIPDDYKPPNYKLIENGCYW